MPEEMAEADRNSTVGSHVGCELDQGSHPAAMWLRRGMLSAMALAVLADLLGLLGVHTSAMTAQKPRLPAHLALPVGRKGRA